MLHPWERGEGSGEPRLQTGSWWGGVGLTLFARSSQTPGSEGNGHSEAAAKQGSVPPLPLLWVAVRRTARQGANSEQTCKPQVLNEFRCCTRSCPRSTRGPFDKPREGP